MIIIIFLDGVVLDTKEIEPQKGDRAVAPFNVFATLGFIVVAAILVLIIVTAIVVALKHRKKYKW